MTSAAAIRSVDVPASGSVRAPSCAWAMHAALQSRGVAPSRMPSIAMLFGLGGGAWCGLDHAPDGGLRLRGTHADRIKLGFYGLNVWSVCFRYLSADAVSQLRERCAQGLQTLVAIDPAKLSGAAAVASEDGEHIVLVTGLDDDGDHARVRICAADVPDGRELPLAELADAWFRHGPDGAVATFYWHPLVELRWTAAEAVPRALRRFTHRMRAQYPGAGPCGLAAIDRLAAAPPTPAALRASALRLCADGGAALYRDHMAEFLREAAEALGRPALLEGARHYARAAGLWHDLLDAAATPAAGAPDGALLAGLAAIERVALGAVERACAMQTEVADAS